MSAICGIFHKKQNVDLNEAEAVMSELGKYRFDRADTFHETPVFFRLPSETCCAGIFQ